MCLSSQDCFLLCDEKKNKICPGHRRVNESTVNELLQRYRYTPIFHTHTPSFHLNEFYFHGDSIY